MITGFNTDIEHGGVIYHVQTEDKGVSTPLILSLVYNRGTILASKRSPYDDLLLGAFDEKALSERLQKQHKLICAAVRAGRIEDLKRMGKNAAPKPKNIAAREPQIKPVAEEKEVLQPRKTASFQASEVEIEKTPRQNPSLSPPPAAKEILPITNRAKTIALDSPKAAASDAETKTAKSEEDFVVDFPVSVVEEEVIIEAVEIVEDELILSAEAVEIISDFADENSQIVDSKLKIQLPDDVTFRSGERKTVNISVYRGEAQNVSSGAHVMIKVFGAAFRPLIFHAKTDQNGAATVHLQMPQFRGGRAAVLIRAMSDGEETEVRRTIEQD